MSRRRKIDYLEVLKELIKAVPCVSEDVQAVVMDFEVPVWQAVRELFKKKAVLRGCIYHWSKAVWDRCLELQLREHYESNRYVAEVINWLMALPYLPEKHIEEAFLELQRMASLKPCLTRLFQYFETTWILGFWTPKDWSVYLNPMRSEEEVEGWIKQLSSKAGRSSLPYYQLIVLLHEECQAVGGHLRIAKKRKVITEQRRSRAQVESLFVKWEKHKKGQLSVSLLLSACSRLRGSVE